MEFSEASSSPLQETEDFNGSQQTDDFNPLTPRTFTGEKVEGSDDNEFEINKSKSSFSTTPIVESAHNTGALPSFTNTDETDSAAP